MDLSPTTKSRRITRRAPRTNAANSGRERKETLTINERKLAKAG
jgi:hypothetical protein